MNFIFDMYERNLTYLSLTGFVIGLISLTVPCARSDCYINEECQCTPDTGDGGYYPRHPLTWRDFDTLFVDGQSLEYLEVYNLKPTGQLPDLSKVIVQWLKTEDGVYINPVSGWFPVLGICYNGTIIYDRADDTLRYNRYDRYGERVRFDFDFLIPEPEPFTGTLFSSCPSRYLINWYCPSAYLHGDYCVSGLQMSITAPDGPENLPWHLVSRDICRNRTPYLDDRRWHHTYEGPQCELAPPTFGNRKKRDALEDKQLWP